MNGEELSKFEVEENRFERAHILSNFIRTIDVFSTAPQIGDPRARIFTPRTLLQRSIYFATDLNSSYEGKIRFFDEKQLVLELNATTPSATASDGFRMVGLNTDFTENMQTTVRSPQANWLLFQIGNSQRMIIPPFRVIVRCTEIHWVLTKSTTLSPGSNTGIGLACLSEFVP